MTNNDSSKDWRDNNTNFEVESSPEDNMTSAGKTFNPDLMILPDSLFPQNKNATNNSKVNFIRKSRLRFDFNNTAEEEDKLLTEMNDYSDREDREFKKIKRTWEDYINLGQRNQDVREPDRRVVPRQNYNTRNNFLSFKDALHLVPDYEGKPENLFSFCRYLENLITTYGNECEFHVLQVLPRKLKGRAAQIFEGSVYSYGSLQEFIKALKLQFSAMPDGETVRSRLRNIAQYKGEPVEDYALRVQLL